MNDDTHRFRERIACISHSSRFEIVLLLSAGDQCVSAVARRIGRSQSCTTRHLQALQRHGLVRGRRDGKQVLFEVCSAEPEVRLVLEAARAGLAGEGWAAVPDQGAGALTLAEAARGMTATAPRATRKRGTRTTGRAGSPRTSTGLTIVPEPTDPMPADEPIAVQAEMAPSSSPPARQELEDYLL
jgi:DNA-binding transcriptional ArsR family regulator